MSSLPIEFHRNSHGEAKALWQGHDSAGQILAQFFEHELAADTGYRERLVAEAEKQQRGQAAVWRTSGNGFAVVMEAKRVSLQPLFGAGQQRVYTIDAHDFLALLHRWQALVG